MKKFGLITICLLLCVFLLTGCITEPPHKVLIDTWLNEEVAEYDVVRTLKSNVEIKGTQTMKTTRVNNATVKIGNKDYENINGSVVEITTALDDGSFMNAKVLFSTSFMPIATYKSIFVKGYENESPSVDNTQVLDAEYAKNYNFTATNNGTESSGSISTGKWDKAAYFDNLMLYHVVRSSFKKDKGFTAFNFKIPSWSTNEMKTLSLSLAASDEKVKIMDTDISTTKIYVSLLQTFPGKGQPLQVWLSNSAVKESINAKVLVKYIEGQMSYTLKNITFVK